MFIDELSKNEAIAFINLFEDLANVDEVFAASEKSLLEEYKEELFLTQENIEELTFEAAIEKLEGAASRIKNIVYFELLGLALLDGSYDEREIKFLDRVANGFGITCQKQNDFINYFDMVVKTYNSEFIDYENKVESLKKLAMELL